MIPHCFKISAREHLLFNGSAKIIHEKIISLKFLKTDQGSTKCAVVVSKKVSKKAVIRNRIRRKIYSTIEKTYPQIMDGYFLVFIVRKDITKLPFVELQDTIFFLLSDFLVKK